MKNKLQQAELREATLADGLAICELLQSLGLKIPETSKEIDAHWRRLWSDNPAFSATEQKLSRGWVIEKSSKIVGFFGNIPRIYYFGSQKLIISVASQWAIKKEHRAKIHSLAKAYFSQKHADVLMATTANTAVGRLYQHYGGQKIPLEKHAQVLFWVLNPEKVLKSALRRKEVWGPISSVFLKLSQPALRAAHLFGFHKPNGQKNPVELLSIDAIDDNFDELWARRQQERPRLLACRKARSLHWYYGDSPFRNTFKLLTCSDGYLQGYCVILGENIPGLEISRLKIVDMFVEFDRETTVVNLLRAAYDYGRDKGYDILEWRGIPNTLWKTVLKQTPLRRTTPSWPLFYKPVTENFRKVLLEKQNWYITNFDGDTTLAN